MGHNDYMSRVRDRMAEGYDFQNHPPNFKSRTVMWKNSDVGRHKMICVITLWEDDTVTEECNKVSEALLHAGFVQG